MIVPGLVEVWMYSIEGLSFVIRSKLPDLGEMKIFFFLKKYQQS